MRRSDVVELCAIGWLLLATQVSSVVFVVVCVGIGLAELCLSIHLTLMERKG